MGKSLMEGNEAIAWGAYDAGCRFFAGYPITPATTIYNTMLKLLPPDGGLVVQGEDEIASLGYCLGAAMAGQKVMTATSGPGISLYSEHISFAIGAEIPVVIVDVQRLGPTTGYATKGADGDVQFLRWGNSGGVPGIVLSPVDVRDSYTLTMQAFNLAEIYRCPVFIATSKEIGMTRESVELSSLEKPLLVDRKPNPANEKYLPFKAAPGGDTPYFAPIGGDVISRQTSSTHGEDGYMTPDPVEIQAQVERLMRKVTSKVDTFSFYESTPVDNAETLVLTYGVTSRAARQACRELSQEGRPTSHALLKTLWPCPKELIRELAKDVKRVVVVEANLGQYVREVERVLPDKKVDFLGIMNGKLISPRQIKEAVNG